MYIVATFKYFMELELTLKELEDVGLAKDQLLVIPLNKQHESLGIDSMHRSDGKSLLDLASFLGMVFMLLGTIYGFVLSLGPIIWGLIGLIFGALVGIGIDYILTRRKMKNKGHDTTSDLVLIIQCTVDKKREIEQVLWNNMVIGIGIYSR